MALDALKGFIDNTLAAVFHRKEVDPTAARKPVVKGIDTAIKQFEAIPQSKAPNRWWKVKNSVVEFAPKVKGHPLLINGEASNFIPSERFVEFLGKLKAEVEAGSFDKELANHGVGDVAVAVPSARRTRRKTPEWSSDPKVFHKQFVDFAGPPPGDGYVPNSKRTKWVSEAHAARGVKAQAAKAQTGKKA